ncbi:MAG TPA: UvrD-helicase domain-containing protein, partial [Burkholderiaceae bacterium]|nr:UvrD-helicase domain-containing protein [Burkholderiaceae bacterium]
RRQGRFGFADLQARLARALAGPSGARLRERIVAQYPAVLIDEFQDTSPLQYRLFDRLYDVAADARQTLLLLIGDPKQSIYGFRGADIYSYLAARQATAGRLHMLGTNHRSTQALVGAVNRVFAQAEAGWTAARAVVGEPTADFGAFALPQVGRHALPFEPVAARGRREVLVASIGGGTPVPLPALNLQWLPKALKAEPLRRAQAEHAAGQMLALLEDPTVGFREGDEASDDADEVDGAHFRRLRPGDVAVLVRSRREAQAIRRALGRRGLRSVYLSDQDSVLRSPEAADLLRWLQAVAEPLDAPRVRAAFATATLGLSAAQLLALRDDEDAWEDRLALLQQLRSVWRRQGVLAMLMRSLHALDLPARWLAGSADGERRLTNWLHLGELLQSAAATLEGEAALIRWLAEEIQAEAGSADERIVRLESDADLIQVVTVHKSKGLEYPLVFLPYAQACWPVDRRGRQVLALPGEGEDGAPVAGRQLVFKLSDEAIAQADRERLREDLRLLYVALTRARHALWLGVGLPAKGGRGAKAGENLLHLSALGHLLGAGQPMAPAAVGELLGQWVTAAAADGSPGATALQRR